MNRALVVIVLLAGTAAADSKLVTVTDQAIALRDPIYFETGKPAIKAASHAILDAVVATMKGDKRIAQVEIQAHTDERGNDEWNLKLSDQRANAIYKYLVDRGIDARRLRAKGYGETQPLDKAHNEKAWAKNRRIAIVILQRTT